jgi:hypothetical protein
VSSLKIEKRLKIGLAPIHPPLVALSILSPFVKIAWFSSPWFIRTYMIIQNCDSLLQIILNLLNHNHPHATLNNIFTFMWCIWKSRNEQYFDRKKGEPYQINLNAQALHNNLGTTIHATLMHVNQDLATEKKRPTP